MPRLEREGVRGADLVFACIGPALEIFSRYSRVETAEGDEVKLPQYLQKVWEVVGRTALAQLLGNAEAQASDGSAGALEEDARLTALFVWTHRSTLGNGAQANGAEEDEEETDEEDDEENAGSRKAAKGFTLIFDIVRRFAQPLGIHLDVWEGRIIETKKGIVRLLPVSERARQLFGSAEVAGRADRIERTPPAARQLELFSGTARSRGNPAEGTEAALQCTCRAFGGRPGDDPRSRAHCHAAASQRPDHRAAQSARRRATAGTRFLSAQPVSYPALSRRT